MAINYVLRKVLLCLCFGAGCLMGAPITPKEIEELLASTSQTRIEVTITGKDGSNHDEAN